MTIKKVAMMAKHYTTAPGIVLSPDVAVFVQHVADRFFHNAKKDIIVTSAYRGPEKQADAMYDKMLGTEWKIYKDHKSLMEIKTAFLNGRVKKEKREQIVSEMAAVIKKQVKKGTYISSHLRAHAVDFQDRLFTAHEVELLKDACRKSGATVVIAEGQPKHLHVQF